VAEIGPFFNTSSLSSLEELHYELLAALLVLVWRITPGLQADIGMASAAAGSCGQMFAFARMPTDPSAICGTSGGKKPRRRLLSMMIACRLDQNSEG
jgi:hypothetical protein